MADLLRSFVNSLQWLNTTEEENLEVFKECCSRFVQGTISDHKIRTIAGHLGIPENVLKESLIAVTRLAMNRIHLKNKGASAIENTVLCSRIVESRRQFIIDLVEELATLESTKNLLENTLLSETRGTYKNSEWRMDIDVSQRSSEALEPKTNFICKLETADGCQTLNFTPAMLAKFEAELQQAVNAVNKAKTARV